MYCLKVLFAVWIPEECRRHEVEADFLYSKIEEEDLRRK